MLSFCLLHGGQFSAAGENHSESSRSAGTNLYHNRNLTVFAPLAILSLLLLFLRTQGFVVSLHKPAMASRSR